MATRGLTLSLVLALGPSSSVAADGDLERLLELHAQGIEAHRRGDAATLLAKVGEQFLSVDDGSVREHSRAELQATFEEYLGSTRFDVYRDTRPPEARVADDGSLGWVIAEVEASGVQTTADGGERPIRFRSAWVSLYGKVDGSWVLVGNASSVSP